MNIILFTDALKNGAKIALSHSKPKFYFKEKAYFFCAKMPSFTSSYLPHFLRESC